MKVVVIGAGYVGLTIACFAEFGHNITLVGRDKNKISMINAGKPPIYEPGLGEILMRGIKAKKIKAVDDYGAINNSDIVFICVGTPSNEDGSIDLSQIKTCSAQIAEQLKHMEKFIVVVVKSTVVPQTTINIVKPILENVSGKKCGADFGLAMNPEFLKEGDAVEDFIHPDKIVLGVTDDRSYEILEKLYDCLDKNIPRIKTDVTTAEMIKYAQNSALASRVSFINEIANICEKFSVDVKTVAYAIGLDNRIGPKFLRAGPGFGGSCFPKDVKAFLAAAKNAGEDPLMLKAILNVNASRPYRMVEMAEKAVGNLGGKNIAVLGLAFKNNTDDIRESPAITVVKELLKKGANVRVYDPQAMDNARKVFGSTITYENSKEECVKDADICMILTEWDEFKSLDLSLVKCPIIDARRMVDPEDAKKHGIPYMGVGWKNNIR
jgi:UDPglucose 6-dehydrogenase